MSEIKYEQIASHQYDAAKAQCVTANEINPDDVYHAFAMMYGPNAHPRMPKRIVVEDVTASVGDVSGPGLSELQALFTIDDDDMFLMNGDVTSFGIWKPRTDSGLYFTQERRIEPPLHGLSGTVQHMVARAVQGFLIADDEYAKLRLGRYKATPVGVYVPKPLVGRRPTEPSQDRRAVRGSLSPTRR